MALAVIDSRASTIADSAPQPTCWRRASSDIASKRTGRPIIHFACHGTLRSPGMPRAVTLAGAATQVVSLWRTEVGVARELMRAFYRELAAGAGRAEALRQAELDPLRQPQHEHPYFWATFVHAGDWTPLPAVTTRSGSAP